MYKNMRQTTIFAFDPLFFKTSGGTTRFSLVSSRLEHPACQTPLFVAIEFTGLRQVHDRRDGRTDRQTDIYLYIETGRQVLHWNIRATSTDRESVSQDDLECRYGDGWIGRGKDLKVKEVKSDVMWVTIVAAIRKFICSSLRVLSSSELSIHA